MAGITLERAQAQLELWLDADSLLAGGKAYSIAGRALTRSDTKERIDYWNNMVQRLTRGGIRVRGATPSW